MEKPARTKLDHNRLTFLETRVDYLVETLAFDSFAATLREKKEMLAEEYRKLPKKQSFPGWAFLEEIREIEEQLVRLKNHE